MDVEILASLETARDPATPSTPTRSNTCLTIGTEKAQEIQGRKLRPFICSKRPNPFTGLNADLSPIRRFEGKRSTQNASLEAESKLNEAYQLVIDAAALAKVDRGRQDKILELVGLFRAFREDKALPTATAKVEKQVSALEGTIAKLTKLVVTGKPQEEGKNQGKATFASIVSGGDPAVRTQNSIPPPTAPRITQDPPQAKESQQTKEWTKAKSRKGPIRARTSRLVLEIDNKSDTPLNTIGIRDKVNQTFAQASLYTSYPILLGTHVSDKGNLVLTPRDEKAKEILEKNFALLKNDIPIVQVLEDSSWHKVVVHGVDTIAFREQGPEKVAAEINAFNTGYTLANLPIWLTTREARQTQTSGSMLLAFKTSEEAARAKKEGLWIGAKHLRVQRALTKEEREEKQRERLPMPRC